jgi:hypothetical protein
MNTYLPFYRLNTPVFLSIFIYFFSNQAFAQSSPAKGVTRLLEVGISANGYRGDLSPKFQSWSPALQLGLKLNAKKRLNGHFNLSIGTFIAQNPDYEFTGSTEQSTTPNIFAKTSFLSLNYDLQVNLIKTHHWIVYLSQGAGLIRFQPKDEQNKPLQSQFSTRPGEENYNNVTILLPTQAGAIYLFDNGFGLGVQSGWLNPQTDYLDNISQWGNRSKKDNVLSFRFSFLAPLTLGKE